MNEDKFLNIEGMAIRYGVNSSTIYRWVNRGQLPPPTKFGNKSRWSIVALDKWDALQEYRPQAAINNLEASIAEEQTVIEAPRAEIVQPAPISNMPVPNNDNATLLIVLFFALAIIYSLIQVFARRKEPVKVPEPIQSVRPVNPIKCIDCKHGNPGLHAENQGMRFEDMLCFKDNFVVMLDNVISYEECEDRPQLCHRKNHLGACQDFEQAA